MTLIDQVLYVLAAVVVAGYAMTAFVLYSRARPRLQAGKSGFIGLILVIVVCVTWLISIPLMMLAESYSRKKKKWN